MAIETLDVTAMLANHFEPKRKNRWIIAIEGVDAFLLKSTARPTATTEENEISWINATRHVAGKTKWNTLSITMHDPIAPSGAQQMTEWLRLVYDNVSGRAGYADFYKRNLQLKMLDPVGTVIELWDIVGVFPTEINFGDLTYEDGSPIEISCTLRFDTAALQF
jgi:hypothetical protein